MGSSLHCRAPVAMSPGPRISSQNSVRSDWRYCETPCLAVLRYRGTSNGPTGVGRATMIESGRAADLLKLSLQYFDGW